MSPVPVELADASLFLATMPRHDLEGIADSLDVRRLTRGQTVIAPWARVTELVFPIDAIISVVSETAEGQSVEVGIVGREGMTGSSAFMGGATSPLHTMCQISGVVLVGRTADLVPEDPESSLRAVALRYSHAMFVQAAMTAACNRIHPLEQRAARWLLEVGDRLGRLDFALTHEFFAVMLGAHRPSVSLAAKMLQQAGLIEYHRGQVAIRDRANLIDASCGCYRQITEHYEQTMGIDLGGAFEPGN